MSLYVLHPEAFDDMDEIWEFIAQDNLKAADRVIDDIHEAIRGLVRFPHQGYRRIDLTSESDGGNSQRKRRQTITRSTGPLV